MSRDKDSKLKSIISLIDDDSSVVRDAVVGELSLFGDNIGEVLSKNNIITTEDQRVMIAELLKKERSVWLTNWWRDWISKESFKSYSDSLEDGFSILCDYLTGSLGRTSRLSILLDDLATEFNKSNEIEGLDSFEKINVINEFLFKSMKFQPIINQSVPEGDLASVLEGCFGSPIALSSIFVLVASRFGLKLELCDFPRHCFVKTWSDKGEIMLFDPYNSGRLYHIDNISNYYPHISVEVKSLLRSKFTNRQLFQKVYHNLSSYFKNKGSESQFVLMGALKQMTSAQGLS